MGLTDTPVAPPLGELSPKVTERARLLTERMKPMKIIVDMMGGDNAPLAVLEGAAAAVKEYGVQLIGVGDEAQIGRAHV